MKNILTVLICIIAFETCFSQDSLLLISDRRIGDFQIGSSIENYSYALINKFRYSGDGYEFFENTYQTTDSCSITVGFNYYIKDTTTISYLITNCEKYQLSNGIRAGIKIRDMLPIDSEIVFQYGYGQEIYYIKYFKKSLAKLLIDNVTQDKYIQETNKELKSNILLDGYIKSIELLKLN